MPDFLNIPFALPIKFYDVATDGGIHFDSDWYLNQLQSFETREPYYTKWQRNGILYLQISSSVTPGQLNIINNCQTIPYAQIEWTLKLTGAGYNVYEVAIDFNALLDGVYYLTFTTVLTSGSKTVLSEPISLKDIHPQTLLFSYKNSYNDFGITFLTGTVFNFRCEAGIMDFTPDSDVTDYQNQSRDNEILSAIPFRQFKLFIGTAPGVAPYIADVLNRIFCCDYVLISKDGTNTKQYVKPASSKWEPNRQKGWPLTGWACDLLEAKNLSGLQINTLLEETGTAGLIYTFNHSAGFFGESNGVYITDIEIT